MSLNRHSVLRVLPIAILLLIPTLCSALEGFDPSGEGEKYPRTANGRVAGQPSIQAYRLNGTGIDVDGVLDESPWMVAEAGTGFKEMEPDRGENASEETVFKVAYDESAIYFAVACYESDPSLTSRSLCRRDRLQNCDMVSIYIDPYHDRTTGYNFRVNPYGVKMDQYVYNDGEMDLDWNAVWEAETHEDEKGWYAEVRIPFSSIRYRPAETMSWGLQVYRWMHGRGEDTSWVAWDRNDRGFVSRFGELTGLRDIRAPRQLEILPYMVQRSTDPSAEGSDDVVNNFQNIGADIKYGLTADLTLTATIQPDFGQVEADPANLNLSPFETYFQEKRPFFVEGGRFFEHPSFNLFYSRRIGTGDQNQRIRYAGKLLGKMAGDVSVAGLFAATDVTGDGQAHNFLKGGRNKAHYAVGRFGKEFHDGSHRINFMQTAVWRNEKERVDIDASSYLSRDAYTSGMDFDLNFQNRTYNVRGSWVATIVDPAPVLNDASVDHSTIHGSGATFGVGKFAGKYRGSISGRLETESLDCNDIGILQSPDEMSTYSWLQRRFDSDSQDRWYSRGQVNLNFHRSWLYADRSFENPDEPGSTLWKYNRGHPQSIGGNMNLWMQLRSFWAVHGGFFLNGDGTFKYHTRTYDGVRGPLLTNPSTIGFWSGFNTDSRKRLRLNGYCEANEDASGTTWAYYRMGTTWVQSDRIHHSMELSYSDSHSEIQWIDNVANPGGGIADVSYIFGDLDRDTWNLTFRSNVLFNRNQSLEVYLQPYLTTGSYGDPKELMTPDSFDWQAYSSDGFDIRSNDFNYASVNLNMVYRWEYRPGSTFYLVWTHGRFNYNERGDLADPTSFRNSFNTDSIFRNEPENTILAKLSYWFSI